MVRVDAARSREPPACDQRAVEDGEGIDLTTEAWDRSERLPQGIPHPGLAGKAVRAARALCSNCTSFESFRG